MEHHRSPQELQAARAPSVRDRAHPPASDPHDHHKAKERAHDEPLTKNEPHDPDQRVHRNEVAEPVEHQRELHVHSDHRYHREPLGAEHDGNKKKESLQTYLEEQGQHGQAAHRPTEKEPTKQEHEAPHYTGVHERKEAPPRDGPRHLVHREAHQYAHAEHEPHAGKDMDDEEAREAKHARMRQDMAPNGDAHHKEEIPGRHLQAPDGRHKEGDHSRRRTESTEAATDRPGPHNLGLPKRAHEGGRGARQQDNNPDRHWCAQNHVSPDHRGEPNNRLAVGEQKRQADQGLHLLRNNGLHQPYGGEHQVPLHPPVPRGFGGGVNNNVHGNGARPMAPGATGMGYVPENNVRYGVGGGGQLPGTGPPNFGLEAYTEAENLPYGPNAIVPEAFGGGSIDEGQSFRLGIEETAARDKGDTPNQKDRHCPQARDMPNDRPWSLDRKPPTPLYIQESETWCSIS